jgi:hypothetical protein
MYVRERLTDNGLSEKLLSVIYRLSVSLSVINISMNLQADKSSQFFFFFMIEYNKSKIKATMDEEEEVGCHRECRGN